MWERCFRCELEVHKGQNLSADPRGLFPVSPIFIHIHVASCGCELIRVEVLSLTVESIITVAPLLHTPSY